MKFFLPKKLKKFFFSNNGNLILKKYENGNFNAHLLLENKSNNKNVLFKIKTTSPEKFLVQKSLGLIPPNSSLNVKIVLQKGN